MMCAPPGASFTVPPAGIATKSTGRIRATPAGRNVLLVALTGWGQAEDRRRTREAGFDKHLIKPVDHHALLELLKVDGSAGSAPTPR